jgi:3-methyladenine DNA glycosylase AlkD
VRRVVATVALRIERELRAKGTRARAEQEKRYLKSARRHFGTPVPTIRAVTVAAVRAVELDRWDTLALVVRLWSKGVHELHMAGVEVLRARVRTLEEEDVANAIEPLLRTAKTWALVDSLSTDVVGALLERFPKLTRTLDRWAKDDDYWVRRAAMLALLPSLRRGAGDFERFTRYADAMLEEKEFFIRKAIGWVLRETSKKRPLLVAEWVKPRAERMSGLTRREATKYLPSAKRSA